MRSEMYMNDSGMESGSFLDYFFGPIGSEYCNYFWFLSVMNFIIFLLVSMSVVYLIFTSKSGELDYTKMVMIAFQPFLGYYINRLFYSMCINSVGSSDPTISNYNYQ